MNGIKLFVHCADSDNSELIDAAEAIVAISESLDDEWKWTRLAVGSGPNYDADIIFYDPLSSGEPRMSAEEVKAHLLSCAERGLRRCRVMAACPHVNDEGECPIIRVYCAESLPTRPKGIQHRLHEKLYIDIEPESLFYTAVPLEDDTDNLVENDEFWSDWLIKTMMSIALRIKPATMHVYRAEEWIPINSHVSYFASPNEVIEDLQLLRMAWTKGLTLPYPHMKPFGSDDGIGRLIRTSLFRSDQMQYVGKQFSEAFAQKQRVTEADVYRAVECGRFDTMTSDDDDLDRGFIVTDLPWFLNSWNDRFYLEVLGYQWWDELPPVR